MKNIPTYTKKDGLKSISINIYELVRDVSDINEPLLFDGEITVSENNPFIFKVENPTLISAEFTPEISEEVFEEADIINEVYLYYTNKLEGTYHLQLNNHGNLKMTNHLINYDFNNGGNEIKIENVLYNLGLNLYPYIDRITPRQAADNTAQFIKNNYKKYNVKIDYFGNPAYETNDVLKIETPYGYKAMRILKHSLTFNGALSGTIEGVGD